MALSVGGLAFMDYGEIPACIHTRLILAEVNAATFEYVILTPDLDMYTEILHHSNPDLVGFHLPAPGGGPPAGIPLAHIYSFAPMQAADYGRFMAAGRAEAIAERARRGIGPCCCGCSPLHRHQLVVHWLRQEFGSWLRWWRVSRLVKRCHPPQPFLP